MARARRASLGCLLAALAGCAVTPRGARIGPPPAERLDPFPYPRNAFRFRVEELPGEVVGVRTSALTYPSSSHRDPANLRVRAVLREPLGPSRGLVVVLPILGGDYEPSDALAHGLTGRGWATLRFDRKHDLFDPGGDPALTARRIRQSVIDVRRGIDWAVASGADGGRGVGLLGVSMGSIIGTLVASSDDRVRSTILALVGGGLADGLRTVRSEVEIDAFFTGAEARGLSGGELDRALAEAFDPLDPFRHAPYLDPARTLVIHARFDALVPLEVGATVREAAGNPEWVVLPTGHYSAALLLSYIEDRIGEHLDRTLTP